MRLDIFYGIGETFMFFLQKLYRHSAKSAFPQARDNQPVQQSLQIYISDKIKKA